MAQTGMQAQGQPQAPPGAPVGAGMGATQEDPFNAPEEPATDEEEQQFEDLFIRTIAAVNDNRKPPKGRRSLADEVVRQLSQKGKEAYIVIGDTAGLIMTQMVDNAKRQGVQYEGSVVMQAGMGLIGELIKIARMSGAIKNLPEEDSEEEQKLVELAALQGSKYFGEYQLSTGQADQMGHRKELDEQMQREADSGQLDDWGMEQMSPDIRASLMQQIGGGGGQGPQPSPQPQAPQGMQGAR